MIEGQYLVAALIYLKTAHYACLGAADLVDEKTADELREISQEIMQIFSDVKIAAKAARPISS